MRKLKFHETKLLKKTNFLVWKRDDTHRENHILKRFCIRDRNELISYNKIVRLIQKLSSKLAKLEKDNNCRILMTQIICRKL